MNDEQNTQKPIPQEGPDNIPQQEENQASQAQTQQPQTAGDPSDTNPLQQDLETALRQVEELTNISKRAMADLANYRKRIDEEKAQFVRFSTAGVFLEILPVYDSFSRAVEQIPDEIKNNEWVKGIESIKKQFEQIMERMKIHKMKTVGEKFDPNLHEAVAQGEGEKDTILEELEPGYMLEDQTIRPARVKVGSGET